MIDHVSIGVVDLERAKSFYDRVLTPLGYRRMMDFPFGCGYGDRVPSFWIGVPNEHDEATEKDAVIAGAGNHVAFSAPNHAAVDGFYKAGLEAGAIDNGGPGLRPHYHPAYYAAFLIDPDGNKIEAVCHKAD
ncbi:Glyoxalase [Azospirillaceae bacterium]